MSTKQPVITGEALIRALRRVGFADIRTKGSHHFLAHPDGRATSVPVHGAANLKPGLLRGILRDVAISGAELRKLL